MFPNDSFISLVVSSVEDLRHVGRTLASDYLAKESSSSIICAYGSTNSGKSGVAKGILDHWGKQANFYNRFNEEVVPLDGDACFRHRDFGMYNYPLSDGVWMRAKSSRRVRRAFSDCRAILSPQIGSAGIDYLEHAPFAFLERASIAVIASKGDEESYLYLDAVGGAFREYSRRQSKKGKSADGAEFIANQMKAQSQIQCDDPSLRHFRILLLNGTEPSRSLVSLQKQFTGSVSSIAA